jgi:hypothetical protein
MHGPAKTFVIFIRDAVTSDNLDFTGGIGHENSNGPGKTMVR